MKDVVITPQYFDKFISGFDRSTTVRLETAGHFPEEEQAAVVSKSILDFLTYKKDATKPDG